MAVESLITTTNSLNLSFPSYSLLYYMYISFFQDVVADFLLHLRIMPPSGQKGTHIFLLQNGESSNKETGNAHGDIKCD